MTKLLNQIKSNHFDYGEDILKYKEKNQSKWTTAHKKITLNQNTYKFWFILLHLNNSSVHNSFEYSCYNIIKLNKTKISSILIVYYMVHAISYSKIWKYVRKQ